MIGTWRRNLLPGAARSTGGGEKRSGDGGLERGTAAPLDGPGGVARAALLVMILLPIAFNAVALWPELSVPVPSLNDDAFHFLLIQRASEALASGENVFDHWSPELDLGFPQLFYYQHLPHLAIVFLHRLLLKQVDLLTLFNLVRYLLMLTFPVTVYWSMRRLGFSLVAASVGATASSLIAGKPGYGFEYDSYIWRGWGLYTQLWAAHLCFIILACLNSLMERGRGYIASALALSAIGLSHLMYSYMLAPAVLVVSLLGLNRANLLPRAIRLTVVGGLAAVMASYFCVPFVLEKAYLNASPYEPAWKYASLGARAVLTSLVNGDLIDYGRLPVLTVLLALGIAAAVLTRTRPARLSLILFVVWLALFFGRPTWGRLIDFLPLHDRLHLHRFVGGVDLAAILLIGLGGEWIWRQLARMPERWRVATLALVILGVLTVAFGERWQIYAGNRQFMENAWASLEADRDARAILATIESLPPGRTNAGRRNSWGQSMRLGSLHFFDLLTFERIPAITPYESFSLNADLIWHFDDSDLSHYNVFNVKYVVAPPNLRLPGFLRRIKETPRYVLYEAPTSGYAQFASVSATVADRSQSILFAENRTWLASGDPGASRYVKHDFPDGAWRGGGGAEGATRGPGSARCVEGGEITEELVRPGRLDLQVECAEASTLVLKMTYHPNWRVAVDGSEVPTFMISPSFIGVDVPGGRHQLRAEYRSSRSKTALLALGACTLVLAVVFRRRLARLGASREEDS
jgi:hypothetical protein